MSMTDHPAWGDYKAALDRLARAGVRMEAAQMMNASDLEEAERAFQEAMQAYDALRERLAEPAPKYVDGTPLLRAWLGPTEFAFRGAAPASTDHEATSGWRTPEADC